MDRSSRHKSILFPLVRCLCPLTSSSFGRRPICRCANYMHTGDDEDPNSNPNSLMLATYADGRTESFWNGLYRGPKFKKKFPVTPNKFFTEADKAKPIIILVVLY